MIPRNLRHLRLFLAIADLGSLTAASAACNVSQPAVTQALARLEDGAGGVLVTRGRERARLTDRGEVLALRVRRAFAALDPALDDTSPRLRLRVTAAQLRALIAVREAENFTLAARQLGLAQPTIHRAVAQLEEEAGRALFERTAFGLVASRLCRGLARAAGLAFSEIDQAEADLAEFDGREAGRIVIGALPLSRSAVLPAALAAFRAERPTQPVKVLDGPYDDLLAGLRRGDIDLILGALRDPPPIGDVAQVPLFEDRLVFVARPGHPLAARRGVPVADLSRQAWAVPRDGTPARAQFDALFAIRGLPPPASIVECGSILLMRGLLEQSDLLGCISGAQAEAEVARGLLARLDVAADLPGRPIGITTRADWQPTAAQRLLVSLIRAATPGSAGNRPDGARANGIGVERPRTPH